LNGNRIHAEPLERFQTQLTVYVKCRLWRSQGIWTTLRLISKQW